jgi:hypothetical protein
MNEYHCEDCLFLIDEDNPEQYSYRCSFDDSIIQFNIQTKSPCKRFHPEEYIRALNADSVMRD